MNKPKRIPNHIALLLCATISGALTGCTTYVEQPQPRAEYPPPPPPAEVVMPPPAPVIETAPSPVFVVRAESDFYAPLGPYGGWVMVGNYGRCWRPGRVNPNWRPYCNGYWQRTDAGWYWVSDEPWAWATYHYGCWDWSPQFGWYWVPRTQWAPAWVSWHRGGGYICWAPLHPSARITPGGIVDEDVRVIQPRAYVIVEERRFLEPVRPTTVIVNNTTIINKTVNITNIKVVNNTVINEGPRTQVIEQASGRKVQSMPVHELRRKGESKVVAKQPIKHPADASTPGNVQTPVRTEPAPHQSKSVPSRSVAPADKPIVAAPVQASSTDPQKPQPAKKAPPPQTMRAKHEQIAHEPAVTNRMNKAESKKKKAQPTTPEKPAPPPQPPQ